MKYFYQIVYPVNLYINTSDTYCELALFNKGQLVAQHMHNATMEHSKVLHTHIAALLSSQELQLQDLSSMAVLNGPGSYTGLRIGLAAAKGFCYALQIPLILFNKLNLLCCNYIDQYKITGQVACIEPARQDEYFFTIIDKEHIIETPSVRHINQICILLNKAPNTKLISTKLDMLHEINNPIERTALSMSYLAAEIHDRVLHEKFDDIYMAEPYYLKKVHINKAKKKF